MIGLRKAMALMSKLKLTPNLTLDVLAQFDKGHGKPAA